MWANFNTFSSNEINETIISKENNTSTAKNFDSIYKSDIDEREQDFLDRLRKREEEKAREQDLRINKNFNTIDEKFKSIENTESDIDQREQDFLDMLRRREEEIARKQDTRINKNFNTIDEKFKSIKNTESDIDQREQDFLDKIRQREIDKQNPDL